MSPRPSRLGLDHRIKMSDDVVSEETPGGITLFTTGRARYWQGNAVAADIIRSLSVTRTVRDVVDETCRAHRDVERDVVERDVLALVHALRSAALVERAPR